MASVVCRAALSGVRAQASSSNRSAAPAKPVAAPQNSTRTCIGPRTLRTSRTAGTANATTAFSGGMLWDFANGTIAVSPSGDSYNLPEWSEFEFGTSPVLWEPKQPKAGETMTVWYNPELTALKEADYVAFNGGFNGPFMCGGAPRGMAYKDRGVGNVPLWSIRVNVPKHARYLEFGFTDGYNWDEGFKVKVQEFPGFEGNDDQFFTKGLEVEMGYEGACEAAIFPDVVPDATMCKMPGGMGLAGQSCDLDIVAGCMDPEAPNYNPMANMEDDSCDLPPPDKVVE